MEISLSGARTCLLKLKMSGLLFTSFSFFIRKCQQVRARIPQVRIQRGGGGWDRGSGPPGKLQVVWVSI